jgi:hypothetical protein
MQPDVIAINAIALGGHIAFYGGGFLPILSIIIRKHKTTAWKTFLTWSFVYAIASILFCSLMYFTTPHFFDWAIPFLNNTFLIAFGVWMFIIVVRTGTLGEVSHQKKIIVAIAIIQATIIWQLIASSYAITSQIDFFEISLAMICFIATIIIHVAIISFTLWVIAATSKTKKLQRYLAGLFAFLCIVIGILNFL